MRRTVTALLGVGLLLAAAAPAAQAQTSEMDPCGIPARTPARASLAQGLMFSPAGYGPFGWGPLMSPWGPDPWGAAAVFGPPGAVANAGPLGPGLTANNLALGIIANGGTLTPSQQVDFASQQQTELSTLYDRYSLSSRLQAASGIWALGLGVRASASRLILPRMCRQQQAAAASGGTSEAPAGAQP